MAFAAEPFAVIRLAARSQAERPAVKWACPVRPEVDTLQVEHQGVIGDYNHYRTYRHHGTPDRAVSIVTMEALASLRQEGYEVRPGDLGENITLEAPEAALSAGVCFRATAGTLLLELTEPITPCGQTGARILSTSLRWRHCPKGSAEPSREHAVDAEVGMLVY
eukprot:gnl/TRDRNA2_/TRDRNA2_133272_c0_seq1.p1 gnl/TRDRNA2_/TRDRNA2_133272_c0~~gnl/TRDRNA2_/TRDRNA2_133272_c0_seq1.p1  ORF type:complete len:184 (+),score=20.89 gnl/TRDRNA2_/TRDRNA2_133272_c0_seq1:61-552(+)